MSDDGLEWQLSVYIESGSVTEQQQATVINERTLEGASVKHFENAVIREISFTPTGTDTRAVILFPNLKKPPMEKLTQQLTEKEQCIAELEAQITQKHELSRKQEMTLCNTLTLTKL
ncbi:hypothetical protein [Rappaport israeli]|uniref:hypothetical protein n=1 Tax=Rappaport israeli TaxID=1839807 RepID=UPI00098ED66F|nr:hypothetical protein [Rappaport israeli]